MPRGVQRRIHLSERLARVARSGDETIGSRDTQVASITKTNVPIGALEAIALHDTTSIPAGTTITTHFLGVVLTTGDARSDNQTTTAQDLLVSNL